MKKLSILVLSSLISVGAFANSGTAIKGKKAANVAKSFERVGAFFDCGGGTCGTEVSNIKCEMTGNSVGNRNFACTLTVTEESGENNTLVLFRGHSAAKSIFNALATADNSLLDCGGGTCLLEAENVTVTYSMHAKKNSNKYSVTIIPAND